jgi:hypothetical protein
MRISLWHREARLVLVVRRRSPGDETWWSPHLRARVWHAILWPALALLASATLDDDGGALSCGLGRLRWSDRRWWSTIVVELDGCSVRKRQLVSAALLKAARYARPAPAGR